jgi:abequosyltransferase
MRTPKLSFCIPTYNYGRYIRTALDSIRGQAPADVEVVVLDGGSTDDTRQVVEKIASAWPALRYVHQDSRGGIDADLARTVELARCEYCWLLSADDALQDGAVRRILAELEDGNDIVLCNRVWCDDELKPVHSRSWLNDGAGDRTVDLSRQADLLSYLQAAQSLGALFSFMSCIGFRRAPWMQAAAATPRVECYSHAGRLFAMARGGARFKYVAAPLVLCRGGTDSFRAGGLARRLLVDLRGYKELANALFPADPASREAFLAVMRREHPLRRWVGALRQTADSGLWREVERELSEYGFSGFELSLIGTLGTALRLLRSSVPGR